MFERTHRAVDAAYPHSIRRKTVSTETDGSSFETLASLAPQDEVVDLGQYSQPHPEGRRRRCLEGWAVDRGGAQSHDFGTTVAVGKAIRLPAERF